MPNLQNLTGFVFQNQAAVFFVLIEKLTG